MIDWYSESTPTTGNSIQLPTITTNQIVMKALKSLIIDQLSSKYGTKLCAIKFMRKLKV